VLHIKLRYKEGKKCNAESLLERHNIVLSALCPCGVYSELSNLENLTQVERGARTLIEAITTLTDR